jgi:hypothetical protein
MESKTMSDLTRSRILEVMAEAWWSSAEGLRENQWSWAEWPETPRMASIMHLGTSKQELRASCEAALTAYESYLHAKGLAVVPVEPTEAMLAAGANEVVSYSDTSAWADAAEAWAAMLAAAIKGE